MPLDRAAKSPRSRLFQSDLLLLQRDILIAVRQRAFQEVHAPDAVAEVFELINRDHSLS